MVDCWSINISFKFISCQSLFFMILYTEKQLQQAHKEYNIVRIRAGMPMVTIDKYRSIYERNIERGMFDD